MSDGTSGSIPVRQPHSDPNKVRVLVAHDWPTYAQALELLLTEVGSEVEVVGRASCHASALDLAVQTLPDVLLIDLHLSREDCLDLLDELREIVPRARSILLADHIDDRLVVKALQKGAGACLDRAIAAPDLVATIQLVAAGHSVFPNTIVARLAWTAEQRMEAKLLALSLTERESQLLELVSRGMETHHIATQLFLSEATVKKHCSHLYLKLGVHNRVQAAVYAVKTGLVKHAESPSEATEA